MTIARELRLLADEIDWLDDQGTFPRKLSWLAARAREIADAGGDGDPGAARALVEESDFKDAVKAAEADAAGWGKTWSGRAMTFLAAWARMSTLLDKAFPPKPPPESTGSRLVVSETRAERAESQAPAPVLFDDDER